MKNKFLSTFTAVAISCSALVAIANDEPKLNMQLASNESSEMRNMTSDISTTAAIKKKFLDDSEINSFSIHVTTINGQVSLAGTVPTESVKDKVVSLAKNTKGVLNVSSNLEVAKAGVVKRLATDIAVTNEIKYKYLTDDAVSVFDISVNTTDGVVTLVGTVPSEMAKSKAVDIAKSTKSVKNVVSKLEIDESSYLKNVASDSAITTTIKLKLLKDSNVNSFDIHVETVNGKVTLKGLVPSDAIKNTVIDLAKSTDKVVKVTPMLKIQK